MNALQVVELVADLRRKITQRRAQFGQRVAGSGSDPSILPLDQRETAGIDQPASQAQRLTLLALRRVSQGNGAQIAGQRQSSVASR